MVKDTFKSEPPSIKKRKTNKFKTNNEVVKEKEWIEGFGMKNLSTGTRLLGIIVQVTSLRLKVALPNMLTGVCDVADISQPYRHYLETQKGLEAEGQEDIEFNTLEHLFQPGQYVLCSVKSVDTTPPFKVHVTIDPEVTQAKFSCKDLAPGMIVSASVVSHEDHGVQFNFGLKNQTGFLPTSEVVSYGQPLPVGRVLLASVQKTNGRVSTLSLKKLTTTTGPPILTSIDSLNPGLLVDGKVDQVLRNGVSVLVLGFFSSTISRLHLPHGDSDDWAEHYSIGSSVRARVTVVDVTALSKTIQLSLLPHVVGLLTPPLDRFPVGHLFPQAVIVRAEGNHGLVCLGNISTESEETTEESNSDAQGPTAMEVDGESSCSDSEAQGPMEVDGESSCSESDSESESDNQSNSPSEVSETDPTNTIEVESQHLPRLYASANCIKDNTTERDPLNLKSFRVGHSLPARVVGHYTLDGLIKVSLQPSVVKLNYPMFETLQIGQFISGTVTVIKPGLGVAVRLSAHAPSAFIPILHGSECSSTDLEKKFTVGQRVNCRVLCLDSETSNIHLTCKKGLMQSKLPLIFNYEDATAGKSTHGVILKVLPTGCVVGLWNRITAFIPLSEMFSGPADDPTSSFRTGQVIQCTILSVHPPKIIASLLDLSRVDLDAAAEQLETIHVGDSIGGKVITVTPDALVLTLDGGTKGILPFVHLSDHQSGHVSKLPKTFPINSRIPEVAVFAKQLSKAQVIVTSKPLLKSFAKSNLIPKSIGDFQSGKVVPGVVNGVTGKGVFVNFFGSISGLAEPVHSTNLNEPFRVGQTVLALIKRVESKRLVLSLNHDEIIQSITPKSPLYNLVKGSMMITSYFDEFHRVVTPKNNINIDQLVLCPGQFSSAKLVAKLPHGWSFQLNEVDGLMMGDYLKELSLDVGSSLECRVLDFNSKLVDISARAPLMACINNNDSIPPVSKKTLSRLTRSISTQEPFEAEIELVKEDYAIVSLVSLNRCLAFVPVKSYNLRSSPFKRFKVGQSLKVRIIQAQTSEPRILAEVVDMNSAPPVEIASQFKVGATVSGKLLSLNLYNLELKVKIQSADQSGGKFGSLHATRVFDHYDSIQDPYQPFSSLLGSDTICRVVSLPSTSNKSLELTAILPTPDSSKILASPKAFNTGSIVTGFVKNSSPYGVFVALSPQLHGLIRPLDLSSDYEMVKNYMQLFVPGMAVECRILKNKKKNTKIQLGLVRAKIVLSNGMIKVPPPLFSQTEYQPGQVIVAQLTASGTQDAIHTGWFPVNTSAGLASVHITDISDDLDTSLSPQQLVKASVLEVNQSKPSYIRLSLRGSCFSPGKSIVKDPEIVSLSDLLPDQKLRGFVLADGSVTLGRDWVQRLPQHYCPLPVGNFIPLNVNSVNISTGQVELSPQSGNLKSNPNTLIFGDEVDCEITNITKCGLQVKVNGHFPGTIPNAQLPCLDGLDIKNKRAVNERVTSLYKPGMAVKGRFLNFAKDSSIFSLRPPPNDLSKHFNSEFQLRDENQFHPENIEPLDIDSGFQWSIQTGPAGDDGNLDVSDLEAEVEASLGKPDGKPKRSHKVAFEVDKTADVHAPEVASDFEKALLASPNSSFVWIQYMAYHLQQAAVAPARAVGLRALSTISVREEQERFNIHVALLNLEFKFGDAESLDKTFQSARVMVNDPKSLYFQLAKLYASSQRFKDAENTYRAATKKYSQMPEVWSALMTYFLERGQLEEARQTLQRSLQSLPKREHLPAIFKAAQLEFKYGEVERGRTLFEGILANNPKRLDMWSVYIDKEIQLLNKADVSTDADIPRRLFRRVLKSKWSTHKMKFLFKKFLSFEKLYGQAHHVDHAKGLALAYVQQLNG